MSQSEPSPGTPPLDRRGALGRLSLGLAGGALEPKNPDRGYWTVEELSKVRDLCEKAGITLAMMWEPFLNSSHVDAAGRPSILLGKSPDRDRDIECFQKH